MLQEIVMNLLITFGQDPIDEFASTKRDEHEAAERKVHHDLLQQGQSGQEGHFKDPEVP